MFIFLGSPFSSSLLENLGVCDDVDDGAIVGVGDGHAVDLVMHEHFRRVEQVVFGMHHNQLHVRLTRAQL
jgi:hypothetical protein